MDPIENRHHQEGEEGTQQLMEGAADGGGPQGPTDGAEGPPARDDGHGKSAPISDTDGLKELVHELGEASKRGRSALIVLLISTLILAIAAFNYRGSWLLTHEYRSHHVHWNEELRSPIDPSAYATYDEALIMAVNRNSENDVPTYKRTLFHDVYDGLFKTVEVPALGIQFYIEDLPFLGSFGLLVVLLWFFYVRRRERGIVKAIGQYSYIARSNGKKEIVQYLFFAISFTQVFNSVFYYDDFRKTRRMQFFLKYSTKVFSFLGPVMPTLILLVVLLYDLDETYRWRNPHLLVPDECYLKAQPGFDTRRFNADKKTYLTEWLQPSLERLDSAHHARVALLRYDAARAVQGPDPFADAPALAAMTYLANTALNSGLAAERRALHDQLDSLRNAVYTPGTLLDFIVFEHEQFDEMENDSYRFVWDIGWEIRILRTLLPMLMLAICAVFSIQSVRIAFSKDTHSNYVLNDYIHHFGDILVSRTEIERRFANFGR